MVDGLSDASDEVRADVADALDDILASPFEPTITEVHRMHASARERWLAWLPHGYVLTYRPHVDGPPPLLGNHVSVLDFRDFSAILGELL